MSLRKVWIVLVKEMRHILRSGNALPTIFIPVLVMLVMSTALAQDVRLVPISVLDRDNTPLSRRFLQALSNSQDIVVGRQAESYEQAEAWFDRGQIKALVVIPPRFAADLSAGIPVQVQVIVDGTDPTTAEHVINQVVSRSQMFGYDQLINTVQRVTTLSSDVTPIDLRVREWYNPGLSNLHGMVPAMLAIALTLPVVTVMSSLARERELGTMEILFATPLRRAEMLVGKVLPYVALGMISAVLCALAAVIAFGIPFRGSFVNYLLISLLFFLASFSLAMILSIFIRTQALAVMAGLLVFMFPGMFLSGIFYPITSMPAEMQMESQFVPTTPLVAAVRGILIKGQSLEALRQQVVLMAASTVVYLLLSIRLFKKKV